MRVYVDQSMCTGTAVCESACSDGVFRLRQRRVSTVREEGEPVPVVAGPRASRSRQTMSHSFARPPLPALAPAFTCSTLRCARHFSTAPNGTIG